MPWCPKCKSEYREGFTVCSDCGGSLISEEEFRKLEEAEQEVRREEARQLLREYAASQGEDVGLTGSLEEGEPDSASAAEQETQGGGVKTKESAASGRLYEDSAQRASENRSAAWALLALGTVGLLAVILSMAGVIPLKIGGTYLFYGVMGTVFLLFIVSGIVSMKNAKIFAGKAETENTLRDTLLEWCEKNILGEAIDAEIGASDEVSGGDLYFRRFECIKAKLNHQFVNLDQGFLDMFIDNYVYGSVFGEDEEKAE